MDKKLIGIAILSVTAALLVVANVATGPARADTTITSHDFSAVTAHISSGGEALYLTDNSSGQMVVFSYDPSRRMLVQRTPPAAIGDLFARAMR